MLNVEDLFLAGLGFDIAGAYLVSRGLLQPVPQLAKAGGTIYALERPQATYAVEDRIRGTVGLSALVLGFGLQAAGYAAVLARSAVRYGTREVIIGVAVAVGVAMLVLLGERVIRPRWRDRILVRVAKFDYERDFGFRDKPIAHVLRALGEETQRRRFEGEDDVAYCKRVFGVEAEVPPAGN